MSDKNPPKNVTSLFPVYETRVSSCHTCPFSKLSSIGLSGLCGSEDDQEWVCTATRGLHTEPQSIAPTLAAREAGAPDWCPLRTRKVLVRWA